VQNKKRNKRSNSQFPALDPHLNLKTRFEQLDIDYLDKLPANWVDPKTGKKWSNTQLKQYLNDFTNESIHADFTTNKKRIHKKKKVEGKNNKHLKNLSKDVNVKFKEIIKLINDGQITNTSKIKLKRIVNQFKAELKIQIANSLSFIDDFYKKEAEDKNNARNRCILTRAKAQGKALGIDDLSESLLVPNNLEDEIIDRIDREKELDFMDEFEDASDSSDET
jgi:hypothetical protein